jgi:GTP-binding protein LepA
MAYHGRQVMLTYEMPLGEIVLDFFDKLKSCRRGYASMDYEFKEYRASDVVKVDILLNGEKVDALVHHRAPQPVAVPRPCGGGQNARNHHVARCSMWPFRPPSVPTSLRVKPSRLCARTCWQNATAATSARKRKLLEKQKAGKKRMKQIGSVEVPQEAFLAILQVED